MDRVMIYALAVADILLGFWILYRGGGRFGLMSYRGFLNREERRRRKADKVKHKIPQLNKC